MRSKILVAVAAAAAILAGAGFASGQSTGTQPGGQRGQAGTPQQLPGDQENIMQVPQRGRTGTTGLSSGTEPGGQRGRAGTPRDLPKAGD
jgi:hypothetical protein